MSFGEKCAQSQGVNAASYLNVAQPQRTFDSLASAADLVAQYRAQVERMLQRIRPRDIDKTALGDCSNSISPARPAYTVSLEMLQDQLGNLGKSLDELDGHI